MTLAYVDTSVLLAMSFQEPNGAGIASRLMDFSRIYSSVLLEAEVASACRRERTLVDITLIDQVEIIEPARSLRDEITRVLDAGYVRGADCFHLATALFIAPDARDLVFLTLDTRQRAVAKTLGFAT